jgi:serine phosphatase RsbU (regulator of sigma subunit)/tetratricopeptide (TPR) repeat protein
VIRLLFSVIGICLSIHICYGIDIDSLEQKLNSTKNRKRKVEILNRYNASYTKGDKHHTLNRFRSALNIASDIKYRNGIATAHSNLANFYFQNKLVDSAIFHYNKALQIYREETNDKKTGETLYNIGFVYYASSSYFDAFEYTENSLDIFSINGDMENMAASHSLLCDILFSSGFDADAIDHCLMALNIYTNLESVKGQSELYNSIGRIYLDLEQFDESYTHFNQAYYLAEVENDPSLLSESLRYLGQYYFGIKDFDEALENYDKALSYVLEDPDIEKLGYLFLDKGMANTGLGRYDSAITNLKEALFYADSSYNLELRAKVYSELGSLYSAIEKFDIAIVFLKQSLFVAQRINADPILERCYKNLANFYDQQNDTENALRYFKLYTSHKDTLFSNQSAIQIAEAEAIYDLEQKNKQIEMLVNENRLREMEAGEKNMINIWLISVLVFVFILTLILYRQYHVQNKVNQALNEQKNAINEQKNEIEIQKESIEKANTILAEKNKQIIDSLEYAKRIQLSLLPDRNLLRSKFNDSFLWYQPRDIVGGDFYWYTEFKNTFCLVVLDCSGHGVPGAFMTVLANTLLNRHVIDLKSDDSPSKVLGFLDENVKKELNQQGIQLSAFEGIDLAACMINTKSRNIKFSGAKMPLYHYSGGKLNHIKGNRYSVGGGNSTVKNFDEVSIDLRRNDIIYLATDGFQDQFGGEKGKKYMKLHFKNLLHSIAELPLEDQGEKLKTVFHKWKNFNLQTDDILILGIKV